MKIGTLLDRVVFDSITVLGVGKCERNRASEVVILFEGFVSIQALRRARMNYMMLGGTKVSDKGEFSESGSINGGMMKKSKPFEHPVITIGVDDVNASLKAIEKKGGRRCARSRTSVRTWAGPPTSPTRKAT
jgi:hypothetical protein